MQREDLGDRPSRLHPLGPSGVVETGAGVVDLVVTDLGVFAIDKAKGGMTLIETAPGVSVDEIRAQTEADFTVAGDLKAA